MARETDTRSHDHVLIEELERLGIHGVPDEDQWIAFIEAASTHLQERDERIGALEEITSFTTEEVARLRRNLTRSYEDIGEMLDVMAGAVSVFHDALQGDNEALTLTLKLARQRFSIALNAEWTDVPIPEDTSDFGSQAATSVRTLQVNLRKLATAISDLVQQATHVAAGRKELELAGVVQQMLVPPEGEFSIPGARLSSWYQPAALSGGDWWFAYPLSKEESLLIIGDVTGHGAPSAIITGAVKGASDLARMGMRASLRPAQLLRMLNRVIAEAARGEYMMTSAAVRLKKGGGVVEVANAGHRHPWRIRGGEIEIIQGVREPPLGAEPAFNYTDTTVEVQPGDLLILFTDGIPEAESPDGLEMGDKVLRALCEEYSDKGPIELRDRIRQAVMDHLGGGPADDDISLVVCEIA
jgi:serine phosphatase RsbU (regulator of sigma subunit)